jgi:hypothetical protein
MALRHYEFVLWSLWPWVPLVCYVWLSWEELVYKRVCEVFSWGLFESADVAEAFETLKASPYFDPP